MREISPAEALVTADILAGLPRRRIRTDEPAVPRRTRQAVRQRLLGRNLVRERYVPCPALLGRPIVTFGLIHPYAEALGDVVQLFRRETTAVNVWSWDDLVFGVFFLAGAEEALSLHRRLGESQGQRSAYWLDCDSREPTIPVFFDYEASWARIAGLRGTEGYPRPLPSPPDSGPYASAKLSEPDRKTLLNILVRQSRSDSLETGTNWLDRLMRGRRQSRLVLSGKLELRAFLDPVACSGWYSEFPNSCVFIHGLLSEGQRPADLFHALVENSGVAPFVFASDASTVLFVCFAKGLGDARSSSTAPGHPLLPTVQGFLRQIVVLRKPIANLQQPVSHEYGRPFAGADSSG